MKNDLRKVEKNMKEMFKKFKPIVTMIWGKLKITAKAVSLAVTYFVTGVVKSLTTSLCILAGVK